MRTSRLIIGFALLESGKPQPSVEASFLQSDWVFLYLSAVATHAISEHSLCREFASCCINDPPDFSQFSGVADERARTTPDCTDNGGTVRLYQYRAEQRG